MSLKYFAKTGTESYKISFLALQNNSSIDKLT